MPRDLTRLWTVSLLLGLLPVCSAHGQGIAINDTGAPPNPHALLDVDGSTHDRGVLLPRMTTAERTAIAGLGAADEGLTVYDSTSKSYWYWDGAQWVQMGGGGTGWELTGNAGTVDGTHFIGTTDAVPLSFRVNGIPAGRIGASFWANACFGREAGSGSPDQINAAFGTGALRSGNTGWGNSAFGAYALRDNQSGSFNVAVGSFALTSNTMGTGNVAVGETSLSLNTLGHSNAAVGFGAMTSNTTGYFNTALGASALAANAAGYYNVAVGTSSLQGLVNGWNNVAVGTVALQMADDSQGNVAIGAECLRDMVQGDGNIAIGAFAMEEHQTGGNNIAIGGGALGDNYTGTGNVAIGTGAGYGQQVSDKLFIQMGPGTAPLIYGEFDTDFVRINHNLGVGCSAFGGGTKVLALENGTPPAAPINGVLLYSDEVSSELKVLDEAGNETTLSPHRFSLMHPSEPMAWSFWSENRAVGRRINVDMLRVVRLVERLSGERLVYEQTTDGTPISAKQTGEGELDRLRNELRQALDEITLLQERVGVLESADMKTP